MIKKNKKNWKLIIIIPARLKSVRLKKKLLRNIKKVPMIVRVADNAKKLNLGEVCVATDSKQIQNLCKSYGINSLMTSEKNRSGTDRISEAYKLINKKFDLIVNLQGDLPLFNKELIEKTIDLFLDPDTEIGSAVCNLKDEELNDKNIVKAKVCLDRSNQGFAEDFLRTINSKKNWFHHIGLYVYRPKILEKFVRLEQTKNEFDRKLEQMRAMDNFMKIKLVKVGDNPPSVDTMYDLKKIRLLFNSNNT